MLAASVTTVRSGPDHLHDDFALAASGVKVDEDYLLPRPQGHPLVGEGNRKARSEQRSPNMGMAIVVVPGLMMLVFGTPGRYPLERLLNVMDQPRLVLNSRQRGSRADYEKRDGAVRQARVFDGGGNSFRNVDYIRMTFRRQFNRPTFNAQPCNHHPSLLFQPPQLILSRWYMQADLCNISIRARSRNWTACEVTGMTTTKIDNRISVEKPDAKRLEELGVASWPVWSKEVSVFDWHYDDREICYFLEGQVTAKTDQGEISFGKGDLVSFPRGLSCEWHVHEPVRKHYKFG